MGATTTSDSLLSAAVAVAGACCAGVGVVTALRIYRDARRRTKRRSDPATWAARVDLAAAYHLCDQMDMNEGICNHLTVMVPGTNDRFLCVPYGLLWSEVTASNLLLVNGNGDVLEGTGEIDSTAFHIHKAIHKRGVVAVLHTHQPYATALCCTDAQDGGFKLEMCHQNSLRFWNEIAYDDEFNGLVLDDDEGERLVKVMNGRRILMHQSHGIIVCGASVAEAFDDLYYLERAARQQILAQSTGKKLKLVGDDVAMGFKNDCEDDGAKSKWANLHYDALKRGLMRGPGRIFCSADYIFPNAAVELIFLVWFSRAAYLFVDELKEHIIRA